MQLLQFLLLITAAEGMTNPCKNSLFRIQESRGLLLVDDTEGTMFCSFQHLKIHSTTVDLACII